MPGLQASIFLDQIRSLFSNRVYHTHNISTDMHRNDTRIHYSQALVPSHSQPLIASSLPFWTHRRGAIRVILRGNSTFQIRQPLLFLPQFHALRREYSLFDFLTEWTSRSHLLRKFYPFGQNLSISGMREVHRVNRGSSSGLLLSM